MLGYIDNIQSHEKVLFDRHLPTNSGKLLSLDIFDIFTTYN